MKVSPAAADEVAVEVVALAVAGAEGLAAVVEAAPPEVEAAVLEGAVVLDRAVAVVWPGVEEVEDFAAVRRAEVSPAVDGPDDLVAAAGEVWRIAAEGVGPISEPETARGQTSEAIAAVARESGIAD